MSRTVEVRPGVYHDSVTLMQLSQTLLDDASVVHAQVSMGTELNLDLLVDNGYDRPDAAAGDLVIAITVADANGERDGSLDRVRTLADGLLAASNRRTPGASAGVAGGNPAARTVRTAVERGASVVLISTPGEHAFRQAIDAIEAGAHPIIFSDNVSVEHEVIIKQRATEAGVLAMGPDCGTVVLDGIGLGFANVVTPGPIALVSASGTGAQQVCAIAEHGGVGIRHVLGLGGRDLTDEVGGLGALAAIRLLDADPHVELIGFVAKTIGPKTKTIVDALIAEIDTPVVTIPVEDLTAGSLAMLRAIGAAEQELPVWAPAANRRRGPGRVLGLYSGGTLAAEAGHILADAGVEADVIDLGDDEYTRGRPHPMIDSRLRVERLVEAGRSAGVASGAADDATDDLGAVLLDVVLGHGAAADPAADLVPALAEIPVPVYVALIGTSDDPQGRDAQARALADAGASVFLSNAAAVRAAVGP
ncbi:MAG: FdrA family protein [Acidimicrobiales bacterium]